MGDRRAFGYIYGDDDGNHHFFALKTAKIAEQVVLVLRDLFQFVFNMKKKDSTGDEANAQVNCLNIFVIFIALYCNHFLFTYLAATTVSISNHSSTTSRETK